MAAEQDAARELVLAARAALQEDLTGLGASARAAVDIPAKVRQSPVKVAAAAGAVGFVVLRGPQRLWSAVRRTLFGRRKPMPKSMLPDEIEKTLRRMGDDGERVRGTLERDFADYVKKAEKKRGANLLPILVVGLARPMLTLVARRVGEYLASPSQKGYSTWLEEMRATAGMKAEETKLRAAARVDEARIAAERAASPETGQVDRAGDAGTARGADPAKGKDAPTGV